MNFKAITLATIIGLSVPVIAAMTYEPAVIAQATIPSGTFEDAQWSVTLEYYDNALSYYGRNKQSGNDLSLRGAKAAGNAQRRVYTWSNGDTTYQVSWQPRDPDFIRVQVFNKKGQVTLNRLLQRVN